MYVSMYLELYRPIEYLVLKVCVRISIFIETNEQFIFPTSISYHFYKRFVGSLKTFRKSSYIATRYRDVTCHNRNLFHEFFFSNELFRFVFVIMKIRALSYAFFLKL